MQDLQKLVQGYLDSVPRSWRLEVPPHRYSFSESNCDSNLKLTRFEEGSSWSDTIVFSTYLGNRQSDKKIVRSNFVDNIITYNFY